MTRQMWTVCAGRRFASTAFPHKAWMQHDSWFKSSGVNCPMRGEAADLWDYGQPWLIDWKEDLQVEPEKKKRQRQIMFFFSSIYL